jgi:hypothetical protein
MLQETGWAIEESRRVERRGGDRGLLVRCPDYTKQAVRHAKLPNQLTAPMPMLGPGS